MVQLLGLEREGNQRHARLRRARLRARAQVRPAAGRTVRCWRTAWATLTPALGRR